MRERVVVSVKQTLVWVPGTRPGDGERRRREGVCHDSQKRLVLRPQVRTRTEAPVCRPSLPRDQVRLPGTTHPPVGTHTETSFHKGRVYSGPSDACQRGLIYSGMSGTLQGVNSSVKVKQIRSQRVRLEPATWEEESISTLYDLLTGRVGVGSHTREIVSSRSFPGERRPGCDFRVRLSRRYRRNDDSPVLRNRRGTPSEDSLGMSP